ncbi:hypothetical protein DL770_003469 [Monosporascus sp. CRB-9-2]|nr:hypothetical protein DL770_003469 [Monosporascus sp. CRB-9-2]
MYRLTEASSSLDTAVPISPVPEMPDRQAADPHTATADADSNANDSASAKVNINEGTILSEPVELWPWLAPLNWSDMQIDGSEQDSALSASSTNNIVHPQSDAGALFLGDFPSFRPWASTGTNDGDEGARGEPPLPGRLHSLGHDPRSDPSGGSSSSSSSSSSSFLFTNKGCPDIGIAQLSQLSTRLYPLHRSSCALAGITGQLDQPRDGNQARSPLIDDTAFKSVAAWILHVSADKNLHIRDYRPISVPETMTAGNTLHNVFSASYHMLEILRCLQVNVGTGTTAPLASAVTTSTFTSASTRGASFDFLGHINPQSPHSTSTSSENSSYFDMDRGTSNYIGSPSQHSNTVVRHLVIACHTLLLNIYVAVLIALQHEVDLRSRCLSAKNVNLDAQADPAVLADIRLVLVVQLCSYLIQCQHQAVDSYLSPPSPTPPPLPPSHQHDPSGSRQPTPPERTTVDREAMSDLGIEVRQRLARLRQTLHI